jgi:hydrogenase/urease accessory protein HupE
MLAEGHIQTVILHLANARFGDYYAGMFHVLSGIEYLLPLIALGLFSGQQHRARGVRFSERFESSLLISGNACSSNHQL